MWQRKNRHLISTLCCNSAFTLIEVLAAVVVLSFGIVIILRALETSLAAMGSSRNAVWGNLLIREILAETKLDMRRGIEIPSYVSGTYKMGPYNDFKWEREAEPVSSYTADNDKTKVFLYKVNIETWRSSYPSIKYSAATYMRQIK